jgi:hypothetical protein
MCVKQSLPEMVNKRALSENQTKNLRAYLDTGDIGALENKPYLHIPYWNAQGLAKISSSPVIHSILPPDLVGKAGMDRAQEAHLARFTGRPTKAFRNAMLRWGVLLMPAGLMLFLIAFAARLRRRESETAPSP